MIEVIMIMALEICYPHPEADNCVEKMSACLEVSEVTPDAMEQCARSYFRGIDR